MQVCVELYSNLSPLFQTPMSEICPRDLVVPAGFTLSCERKFILGRCEHKVIVAIGPVMGGSNGYYYHKQILEKVVPICCGGAENIAGGGSIEFTFDGKHWSAKFGGRSGDFGAFDPIILSKEFRESIRSSLNMPVLFSWEDWVS